MSKARKIVLLIAGLVVIAAVLFIWIEYVPFIDQRCIGAGGRLSIQDKKDGISCCSALSEIYSENFLYPCEGPGCNNEGCSIMPPGGMLDALIYQCASCGNSICEGEFGENRCNCSADCQ